MYVFKKGILFFSGTYPLDPTPTPTPTPTPVQNSRFTLNTSGLTDATFWDDNISWASYYPAISSIHKIVIWRFLDGGYMWDRAPLVEYSIADFTEGDIIDVTPHLSGLTVGEYLGASVICHGVSGNFVDVPMSFNSVSATENTVFTGYGFTGLLQFSSYNQIEYWNDVGNFAINTENNYTGVSLNDPVSGEAMFRLDQFLLDLIET
jgi:hypothetical protein